MYLAGVFLYKHAQFACKVHVHADTKLYMYMYCCLGLV